MSPLGSFLRIVTAVAWKDAAELLSNSGAVGSAATVQFTGTSRSRFFDATYTDCPGARKGQGKGPFEESLGAERQPGVAEKRGGDAQQLIAKLPVA